jgi:hypothetical protein
VEIIWRALGVVVGRIMKGLSRADRGAVAVDARFRLSRGSHANARLRGDTRGRDRRIREELAAGMNAVGPTVG